MARKTKAHNQIVEEIKEGMQQAIEVAKGNMPVGTRTTIPMKESFTLGNVKFPAGRYQITRVA